MSVCFVLVRSAVSCRFMRCCFLALLVLVCLFHVGSIETLFFYFYDFGVSALLF